MAQAIPVYSVSAFLLPYNTYDDPEKMNSFLWGLEDGGKKKIHSATGNRLCVPKKFGGLGFRSMYFFNLTLLVKQWWRFLTQPRSPPCRNFKTKYFPISDFIGSMECASPSFIWKSIHMAKVVLLEGTRCRIGK